MKKGKSSNKPNTCFEYVARAQQALEPYQAKINSEFTLAFLKAIELMVLADSIKTASDPALTPIIEIASRGTGIPNDVVRAYAEMTVAMNQTIQIYEDAR